MVMSRSCGIIGSSSRATRFGTGVSFTIVNRGLGGSTWSSDVVRYVNTVPPGPFTWTATFSGSSPAAASTERSEPLPPGCVAANTTLGVPSPSTSIEADASDTREYNTVLLTATVSTPIASHSRANVAPSSAEDGTAEAMPSSGRTEAGSESNTSLYVRA